MARNIHDDHALAFLAKFSHLNKSYSKVFTGGREGKYNGSFFKRSDLAVPQLIMTSQSDFRLTA